MTGRIDLQLLLRIEGCHVFCIIKCVHTVQCTESGIEEFTDFHQENLGKANRFPYENKRFFTKLIAETTVTTTTTNSNNNNNLTYEFAGMKTQLPIIKQAQRRK